MHIGIKEEWYRIIDDTAEDYLFNPDMFEIAEE